MAGAWSAKESKRQGAQWQGQEASAPNYCDLSTTGNAERTVLGLLNNHRVTVLGSVQAKPELHACFNQVRSSTFRLPASRTLQATLALCRLKPELHACFNRVRSSQSRPSPPLQLRHYESLRVALGRFRSPLL